MNTAELWLYGSVARGDHDSLSDLDLLVVGEYTGEVHEEIVELPHAEHACVRQYTWPAITSMAGYGSLFLLHLKLEGRCLARIGQGPPRLSELLDKLPDYTLAQRDIVGFTVALDDVRESLGDGGEVAFELSVIATVIRHCSILACYLLGTPTFDRAASITRALRELDLGSYIEGALNLYDFRLAQNRGIPVDKRMTVDDAVLWCSRARSFVSRVGAICGE